MFGKVLGVMIGAGVGFLAQSELAAVVLGALGAFLGHLYDTLHAPPDYWEDSARPLPPRPERPARPSPPPPRPSAEDQAKREA